MKTIEIVSKGETYKVIVDDDIELPRKPYMRGEYALVKVYDESASRKRAGIPIHRYVMELGKGEQGKGVYVDHINGNKLDNRRDNLRLATNKMNQGNRIARGYIWNKVKQKWQASISTDGVTHHLGDFTNEEDARCAYRKAHIDKFGEFSPYYNDQLYFDFDTNEIKSL